jgi:hypothetical protein
MILIGAVKTDDTRLSFIKPLWCPFGIPLSRAGGHASIFHQGASLMAGTVPEAAELDTLADVVNNTLVNAVMRLIGSNFTPGPTTTLASLLAIEAAFTGYATAPLTTWTTPAIDGTTAAISTSTQGQFTGTSSGGTGNLYGYFLTNSAGTKFYGVEKFASAPISEAQNITLEIDCTYSLITRF